MSDDFGTRRGWQAGGIDDQRGFLARNQRFVWLILVVAAVIAGILWLKPPASQSGKGRFGSQGPTPVGIAVAKTQDVHVEQDALGSVTPLATANVRPQVSGQIVKINFQEGQSVKEGDVLAEIDPRPYQATLDQAKGALARDQASLDNARVDLKRYQTLFKANAISDQQLATQQATVKQDEALVLSDNANVETAEINLGYTKIKAPVSGLVGLRQVDLGNLVTSGQAANIAVVTQMQPMSVLFTVPEDQIDAIRAEAQDGKTLIADAYDRANVNKIATGKLSSVDNEVDPSTGTVKLRALFDNESGELFPNQFVNIHLRVTTLHDQTTVPSAALQQGAQGNYVFVVYPDKTVHLRTVTAGVTDNGVVQVVSGLKPGDTVVVDGADRLSEGAPVALPDAKTLAIAKPSEASAGAVPAELIRRGNRGGFALMKKLTADEREKLHAMSREDRMAWLKEHKAELEKRPDQPGSGEGHRSGGGEGRHTGGGMQH